MYSVTGYPDNLTNFCNEKTPMLAVSLPILNLQGADAFFKGIKATFWTTNVHGKRLDNVGKDKIIHLFLKTGKSAGEF